MMGSCLVYTIVIHCTNQSRREGKMREREPTTQTMKASQARQEFSQLLNKVFRRETRVIVEKSGIPVAAIISAEDLKRLQQLEEQRQRNFAAIEAVGAAFKDVPDEEL